jgi:hypothetical protein
MNSAAKGGGIAFTFNPVNGDTGISKTNVSKLNDGAARIRSSAYLRWIY